MISCLKCLYTSEVYPGIKLDAEGVCDVCHNYDTLAATTVKGGNQGKQAVQDLVTQIKRSGQGKAYDCLVGVSGGVDSSYIAYLTKEWGLRPLILHVDNGWNSELAVQNIEILVDKLGFDLYTEVLDWNQMKDLQLAFFKAGVLDIDLPFDNAFMAVLYSLARQHKIKYIISGHNTLTEGWMPSSFCHYKLDTLNLKAIHSKFGTLSLNGFPMIGPLKLAYYQKCKGVKMVSPLDYISYNKSEVKQFLTERLGWRDYGGKHYENIFTKFYQGHILPQKFSIDKRIAHLSTLICSKQISREEALIELDKEPYDADQLLHDKNFFAKKMDLTMEQFEQIMNEAPVSHLHYNSYLTWLRLLSRWKRKIQFWKQ